MRSRSAVGGLGPRPEFWTAGPVWTCYAFCRTEAVKPSSRSSTTQASSGSPHLEVRSAEPVVLGVEPRTWLHSRTSVAVELRSAAVSAAAQVVPGFIANEEVDTVSLARRRAADAREAVRTARMLANDLAVTAERTHLLLRESRRLRARLRRYSARPS